MKKFLSKQPSPPSRETPSSSRSSIAPSEDSYETDRRALFGQRSVRPPSYTTNASSTDLPSRDPYAQDPYARDPYANQPLPFSSRQSIMSQDDLSGQDYARNALFGNRPTPGSSASRGNNYGYRQEPSDQYDDSHSQAQDVDEDIEAIKQEIRFTKQESLSSTRNAIRIATEAEEQGRNTIARLGAQSDKLAGVERNLDVSAAHARIAEDKAKELKKLNRSIFAINVSNPFNKDRRLEEEEQKIIDRHEREREEREVNRKFAYDSSQRINSVLNKPGIGQKLDGKNNRSKSTIAQRSQFSFEEDEEDIQVEKDIDANLNTLSDVTRRLKGLALATQTEIESQNEKLGTIGNKGDVLDTKIHLNTKRLERIR